MIVASWLTTPAAAQTLKPIDAERDQVRPLFKLVEEVAAGRPAPADVAMKWYCHFVNAEAGVVVVPFTLTIESGEFA